MNKHQQLIKDAIAKGYDVRPDGQGGADIIKGRYTAVRVYPNGWCMRLGVHLSVASLFRTGTARKILGL